MKVFIAEAISVLYLCNIAVIFRAGEDFTCDDNANTTSPEKETNETEKNMCGVPFESPLLRNRIVGGREAQHCGWPWQVSVQRLGRYGWYHTCGGSIIHERWIITAAHCVYPDRNASHYRVVVGEFNRFQPDANEQLFYVHRLVIHEKYVGRKTLWDCDIALLEIDGHCPITACSMPICLPSADNDTVPMKCYATGWGRDIDGGKATHTLHEVQLTAFDRSTCNQPSWYANFLTDRMICAGDVEGGRGTCTGDSGGPLACVDESLTTWTVYGLASWAKVPCAGPDSPTVFTRVSAFVIWIKSNIKKTSEY